MGSRKGEEGMPSSGGVGSPTERAALRVMELQERIAIIDGWIRQLGKSSLAEVIAAEFFLRGAKINEIAEDLGVDWHQAQALVECIPILILHRHYPGEAGAKRRLVTA